jgi:hypothetical protein
LSQGSATLLGHLLPNKSKLPITACKAVWMLLNSFVLAQFMKW